MDDFPEKYIPGAISLIEQLDKKLLVVLRDGRTLIGYLRTIDQFANLLLECTIERIHVDNKYGDIARGIYLVRGENVVLAGEIDLEKEHASPLEEVSVTEVLVLQQQQQQAAERLREVRNRALVERGLAPIADNPLGDDV